MTKPKSAAALAAVAAAPTSLNLDALAGAIALIDEHRGHNRAALIELLKAQGARLSRLPAGHHLTLHGVKVGPAQGEDHALQLWSAAARRARLRMAG